MREIRLVVGRPVRGRSKASLPAHRFAPRLLVWFILAAWPWLPPCAAEPREPTCALQIRLVERASGETLPGVVAVSRSSGEPVPLAELINRGQGIEESGPIHGWWVIVREETIHVPAAPLVIRSFAGLETERTEMKIDLTGRAQASIQVQLDRFYDARRNGYLAGNTHLHLRKLSKSQADRYLQTVPLGDGLDVVFLSYLERAAHDLEYTSNHYTREQLEALSTPGTRLGHGEEHRHNFGHYGQGYGHILLLDLPYVIRPVSIGPGLTRQVEDAPPLQVGIEHAHRVGGKVVWAHNLYGFEDIPNWVTGRVDANNIFDGSARGSYKDSYYRYLNIGLAVPFSTGTDWFIYDFSRVYVLADRPVTPREWLSRLAAGKSYITNGPLLEFTVDRQPLGGVIRADGLRSVGVRGRCVCRHDFKRLELVRNGRVVHASGSRAERGHFVAEMDLALKITEPSWLALRTPPPPMSADPQLQEPVGKNEFGGQLFSHTSPIYLQIDGRGVFDVKTAEGLLAEMKSDVKQIETQATFHSDAKRRQVLGVYGEAIDRLEARLASERPSP